MSKWGTRPANLRSPLKASTLRRPNISVAFVVVDDTVSLSIVSSVGFFILLRKFPLKIGGLVAEADNYAVTSTGRSISHKNYGALVT